MLIIGIALGIVLAVFLLAAVHAWLPVVAIAFSVMLGLVVLLIVTELNSARSR